MLSLVLMLFSPLTDASTVLPINREERLYCRCMCSNVLCTSVMLMLIMNPEMISCSKLLGLFGFCSMFILTVKD